MGDKEQLRKEIGRHVLTWEERIIDIDLLTDFFYSKLEAQSKEIEKHKRATSEYFERWEIDKEIKANHLLENEQLKDANENSQILLEAAKRGCELRDAEISRLSSLVEAADSLLLAIYNHSDDPTPANELSVNDLSEVYNALKTKLSDNGK